jgi:hypothetical protein
VLFGDQEIHQRLLQICQTAGNQTVPVTGPLGGQGIAGGQGKQGRHAVTERPSNPVVELLENLVALGNGNGIQLVDHHEHPPVALPSGPQDGDLFFRQRTVEAGHQDQRVRLQSACSR